MKTFCHFIGHFGLLFCLQIILIQNTAFSQPGDLAFSNILHTESVRNAVARFETVQSVDPSIVSDNTLLYFNGAFVQEKVELSWILNVENHIDRIVVERHDGNRKEKSMAEFWLLRDSEIDLTRFSFKDSRELKDKIYYRLKFISSDEKVEFSNWILVDRNNSQSLSIIPSKIKCNTEASNPLPMHKISLME